MLRPRQTSGTLSAFVEFGQVGSSWALFGDDFAYTGGGLGGSINALTTSFGNQRAGHPIDVGGGVESQGGALTFQDVTYRFQAPDSSSFVLLTSPSFTLPADGQQTVDFTLPFTLSGILGFSRGGGPTFERVLLNITGSGMAHGAPTAYTASNGCSMNRPSSKRNRRTAGGSVSKLTIKYT